MTPPARLPNIAPMEQELEHLEQRVNRLLESARRLADENRQLRAQLDQSRHVQESLQQRIDEARATVQNALSRLPAATAEGA